MYLQHTSSYVLGIREFYSFVIWTVLIYCRKLRKLQLEPCGIAVFATDKLLCDVINWNFRDMFYFYVPERNSPVYWYLIGIMNQGQLLWDLIMKGMLRGYERVAVNHGDALGYEGLSLKWSFESVRLNRG